MGCVDCDGYCTCPNGNPPCGFCEHHGECIVCGAVTCQTVLSRSDGDIAYICLGCQAKGE